MAEKNFQEQQTTSTPSLSQAPEQALGKSNEAQKRPSNEVLIRDFLHSPQQATDLQTIADSFPQKISPEELDHHMQSLLQHTYGKIQKASEAGLRITEEMDIADLRPETQQKFQAEFQQRKQDIAASDQQTLEDSQTRRQQLVDTYFPAADHFRQWAVSIHEQHPDQAISAKTYFLDFGEKLTEHLHKNEDRIQTALNTVKDWETWYNTAEAEDEKALLEELSNIALPVNSLPQLS